MKQILILRHAKSSWDDARLEDHDRPLAARGLRDAPRVGRLIRAHKLVPDLILCSTAERARATADLVVEACGFRGELRILPGLYPGDPASTVEYLRGLGDSFDRVLVVGHNPAHEGLLATLTGEARTMPTAALAVVQVAADRWGQVAHGAGRLRQFWAPRDLPE